jgi:hypothetical protein
MVINNKKIFIFLLQVFLIFEFSCSSNKGTVRNSENQNIEVKMLIEKWQTDSLGCLKLRNKKIAETIIDSLKLENSSQLEFIKVFGVPNTERNNNDNKILIYYFDTLCQDNNIVAGSDCCYAEFTFKFDKLIRRNYICQ